MRRQKHNRVFVTFTTDPACDFNDPEYGNANNNVGTSEDYAAVLNNKLNRIISDDPRKVTKTFTKASESEEFGDSSVTIKHDTFLRDVVWEELLLC